MAEPGESGNREGDAELHHLGLILEEAQLCCEHRETVGMKIEAESHRKRNNTETL